MSRNPRKKIVFLAIMASVTVVALVLLCIGLVI